MAPRPAIKLIRIYFRRVGILGAVKLFSDMRNGAPTPHRALFRRVTAITPGPGEDDSGSAKPPSVQSRQAGPLGRHLETIRERWQRVCRRAENWWRSPRASVLRQVLHEWHQDRVGELAAAVAFFAVLGLVPGMVAIIASLGSLDSVIGTELAQRAEGSVVNFLQSMLTNRASFAIDGVRDLFRGDKPGIISFSMLGVIWAFSRSLVAVLRALEVAYDLPQDGWWRRRLKAVSLALITILILALLLVVVIVGPLLGAMRALFTIADLEEAVGPLLWLRFPLAFALLVAWAWMIYHLGPDHQSPWRWDFPGALLTGFLWLLASVGFRLYLEVAGDFNQVFGLLGGALTVMVWIYLLSIALLTGGELNAVLGKRRGWVRPVKKA